MRQRIVRAALVVAVALAGCTASDDSADSTVPSTIERTDGVAPSTPSTSSPPSTSEPGPDFDDIGSIPPGAAGQVTGPLGSTEIRVDTDAGTVQIGSGSVPERLGPAFPLPPDFVVQLASETDTDIGFSGTTDWAFDDLIEMYETGLPDAGYLIESIDRRGSDFAIFEFTNALGLGQVAISETPGAAGHILIIAFGDGEESGDGSQLEN